MLRQDSWSYFSFSEFAKICVVSLNMVYFRETFMAVEYIANCINMIFGEILSRHLLDPFEI